MAWYTELGSTFETQILKRTGALPRVEVIIDPDGDGIKLDRRHDLDSIDAIEISRSMIPGEDNKYAVDGLTLVHNDPDEFFSPGTTGGKFRDIRAYLMIDHSASGITLQLTKGGGTFERGDTLVISSNGNTENDPYPVVTSVNYAGADYDEITINQALVSDHVAGTYVFVKSRIGDQVDINFTFNAISETQKLYTGFIASPIGQEEGLGILNIKDARSLQLNKPLLIKNATAGNYGYYDHAQGGVKMLRYNSSAIETNRGGKVFFDHSVILPDTDSGYITAGMQAYDGCPLGAWTIEFKTEQDFTVTGPGAFQKNGTTVSDFYDGTDATDSFIKITAATMWANYTPEAGDKIVFYTCITYLAKTASQIIHDLLTYFGGVDSIDASSDFNGTQGEHTAYTNDEPLNVDTTKTFDKAFQDMQYERLSICFYEPVTILEAVELVSQMGMSLACPDRAGKWKLHTHAPDPTKTPVGTVSNTTNLIDVKLVNYEHINSITVHYAYNYKSIDGASGIGSNYSLGLDARYSAQYTYPENDAGNDSLARYGKKISIDLDCPGIYDEFLAQALARRYYNIWKDGLRVYDIMMDWEGINLEIGDHITLESTDPTISTTAEIFSVRINTLNNWTVKLLAFDVGVKPDRWLVLDHATYGLLDRANRIW